MICRHIRFYSLLAVFYEFLHVLEKSKKYIRFTALLNRSKFSIKRINPKSLIFSFNFQPLMNKKRKKIPLPYLNILFFELTSVQQYRFEQPILGMTPQKLFFINNFLVLKSPNQKTDLKLFNLNILLIPSKFLAR